MTATIKIAPSLLAADFACLGDEVARIEPHVEMLHIDVMDGHFVPNLAIGIPVIASLRGRTSLVFDCHLMITNPEAYLAQLKEAGADLVTVHIEVHPDPTEIAAQAADLELGFGLVMNPPTPFDSVRPFIELCDMVLVMSVEPGFGGQAFMPEVLDKVEQCKKWVDSASLHTDIQIDGGISPSNVGAARAAGADVFVAGSAIFRAPDPVEAIEQMRAAIDTGESR